VDSVSPEDLEVVRRAYEAFARGDIDGLLEHFVTPDVEWRTTPQVMFGGTHRGVDEMRDRMADWTGPFEEFTTEVEEMIDAGVHVVVCHRMRGRGRDSGVEVDLRLWQVVSVRDGKLVRMHDYSSRAEALAAAAQLQG
jgi:ketosteroid isomerase-like protein